MSIVDMEEFADLQSLCNYLEGHATEFKYLQQVGDCFQKLRDRLAEGDNTEDLQSAQWEIDAFNFMPKDGQLVALFEGKDREGNDFKYPSFERLSDDAFTYYESRQRRTNNPALKARYSHVLWQSPKKTQQHALAAVKAYLRLIPVHEKAERDNPEGHFGHNVIDAARNALLISFNASIDADKAKAEAIRLVKHFSIQSQSWFRLRYDLISSVLEYKRFFDASELSYIPALCDKTAEHMVAKGNLHGAITMYELGQAADSKLQTSTCDWNRKIAESYETLMLRRDKDPMSASHFCEQALIYFRKIKDDQKASELEEKRQQFVKTIQPHSIGIPVDTTEHTKHIEWCKQVAQEVAERPADQIIVMLTSDQDFLPDVDDVERLARESQQNHPLLTFAPETILDDRRHIVQHVVTPDEKDRSAIIKLYDLFLQMDKLQLLHEVLIAAYEADKLSAKTMFEFLRANSWLGVRLRLEISVDNVREYTWMDLLEPGLEAYFRTLEIYTQNGESTSASVLTIDSLSMKFEGLLRDLCRFQGGRTTFDKPDKSGRIVTHEKDITVLLREQVLIELLSPGDLLFLRYLLVDHLGMGLRHKVAHCLLSKENYDLGRAHLLFLGIMRLGKYDITSKMDDPPTP